MVESNLLLKRMLDLGLTKQQLSDKSGVPYMTVSNILKKGPEKAGMKNVLAICAVLGIDANELAGDSPALQGNMLQQDGDDLDVFKYENILPVQPWRVPLLGSVSAGQPIYEPEDFDVSIPVGSPVRCDYALRVKGDSMKPTYLNGDIVLVRKQNTIDDGRIAIVAVGEEATLKHVYRTRNGVTLVSDNPDYPPMPYIEDECDEIRIMGKPVAYLRGV